MSSTAQESSIRRNDSISTIPSSLAAADILQQYRELNKNGLQKSVLQPNTASNSVPQIDQDIHLGNNIYHIHHYANKADTISTWSDLSISFEYDKLKKEKTTKRSINFENIKPKLAWIISISIVVICILAAFSVSSYYLIFKNEKNYTTETPEDDSTTSLITTSEVTTSEIATNDTTSEATTSEATTLKPFEEFIKRDEWGAESPKSSMDILPRPIKRIIIGHTGEKFCYNKTDCISTVKSLQFADSSLADIPYNFLIGGDDNVYEGRGFDYEGQHTKNKDATEYNSIGICIAFIGNYSEIPPTENQINLLKEFISKYVKDQKISSNHIIVHQDSLKYFQTKATELNNAVESLENYRPLHKIYRREEWNAQINVYKPTKFNRVMDWTLIGHTVTPLCNDLISCKNRVNSLQNDAIQRDFGDIYYNIVIGGDGLVFEGRGWDYWAAHAYGFNHLSIGVGAIGDFTSTPPNEKIINAMLQVFDDAMALGKLTEDYKIFGRSDFGGPGPGEVFMDIIRGFCRYGNRTTSC